MKNEQRKRDPYALSVIASIALLVGIGLCLSVGWGTCLIIGAALVAVGIVVGGLFLWFMNLSKNSHPKVSRAAGRLCGLFTLMSGPGFVLLAVSFLWGCATGVVEGGMILIGFLVIAGVAAFIAAWATGWT